MGASARLLSESGNHNWQPTALLNDLCSAHLMRRLILQHASPLRGRNVHEDMAEDLAEDSHESLAELRRVVEIRAAYSATVLRGIDRN